MRFIWVLLLSPLLAAQPAKTPVNGADLLKIRRVTEVAVSKDGSVAVFGVQSIHTDTGNKEEPVYSYRTNLYRVSLGSGKAEPQAITSGDRSDNGIAISPDGKKLAFVRADAAKKVPQVWLMPLDGAGEAEQITQLEGGAVQPVWHPKSNGLLVTSMIPISKMEGKPYFSLERPLRDWFDWDRPQPDAKSRPEARPDGDRRAIRNWLERNASKDNPTIITRLAFQEEMGLQKEMRIPQLYFIDLSAANKTTRLTKDFRGFAGCSYAPAGDRIVCASRPDTDLHPDRVQRSSIWMLHADGGNPHAVLDLESESYQSAKFSSDGKSLLVVAAKTDDSMFRQSRLGWYDLVGKKMTWVGESWGSAIQQAREASDGSVLFTSSWQGGVPLKRIAGGVVENVIGGPTGVSVFDEGGGRTVYALISVPNPNELFVRERDGGTRRLTHLNTAWLEKKKLSLPKEKWITRPDGVRVQAWVMDPVDATPGKKYSWVLDMHGGPSAMWGPGELSMWHEFQLFCAWGYGVVYANPRGSSGYGYEFQKANYKNWGEGPSGDVLAALDETVKSNPLVDKDRLFLTGGSYAGYLTAWIIGHDHRFKAAAAQRGVYDLTTFYGEGNAYRLVKNHFGGMPYDPDTRRLLEQQSPFTYVQDIRTPFLILHGNNDLRTGVTQSEMMYRALKDLGRPVEYVRYPNIGHELTRSGPPLQRMDHMLRIVEFFERFAQNDAPAPSGNGTPGPSTQQ